MKNLGLIAVVLVSFGGLALSGCSSCGAPAETQKSSTPKK